MGLPLRSRSGGGRWRWVRFQLRNLQSELFDCLEKRPVACFSLGRLLVCSIQFPQDAGLPFFPRRNVLLVLVVGCKGNHKCNEREQGGNNDPPLQREKEWSEFGIEWKCLPPNSERKKVTLLFESDGVNPSDRGFALTN